MTWTRKLCAALLGATAALGPGVLGACYTVFGPVSLNADGTPDNAPLRGASLFLFASPVLFAIVSIFYGLSIQLLQRAARCSFLSLCAASVAATIALWTWQIVRDGVVSIDNTIISTVVAAFLVVGSLASWIVLRTAPNQPLQPTQAARPNNQQESTGSGLRG